MRVCVCVCVSGWKFYAEMGNDQIGALYIMLYIVYKSTPFPVVKRFSFDLRLCPHSLLYKLPQIDLY